MHASGNSPTLRLALWNVEWATPSSERGRILGAHLASHEPHLICLTEGCAELLPDGGHVLDSGADYGYDAPAHRRKVLLWSRNAWTEVDRTGHPGLPGGRFASGVTETPLGPGAVSGVCIPWRDAHLRTGRKDRAPWEDHRSYLEHLPRTSHFCNDGRPTLVLGDFNQRIPRKYTPEDVFADFMRVFRSFEIPTAGIRREIDGQLIDHIAHGPELAVETLSFWPKRTSDGIHLSDHVGIRAVLGPGG